MNDLEETLYRALRAATMNSEPYVEIPDDLILRMGLNQEQWDGKSRDDIVAAVSGSMDPGKIASDIPLVCGAYERSEIGHSERWCLWYPAHEGTHGWEDPTPPPSFP